MNANLERSQHIRGRRMVFCERLQTSFTTDELITNCNFCGRFFILCCQHHKYNTPSKARQPCHHFRLMFTDGSCLNNGQAGAAAGIGIAVGTTGLGKDQLSIPIDDAIDPANAKRTSQRAELLAALQGIYYISDLEGQCTSGRHTRGTETRLWVIATDSEYVVKGITEWLPVWKKNNWRSSGGSRPSNLDLFQKIDALITQQERICDVKIGFWHVPREFNQLADSLAKRAAQSAARASPQLVCAF